MKQGPINVVFAADDNYVQHMAVTMLSLLHTKKVAVSVNFTVIGDGLSEKSIAILKEISESNHSFISFPVVDFSSWEDLKVNYHFSRAMYGRLLIPDIIAAEKIIYLDCDTVIRSDISDLWNTDIDQYYAGAVIDPPLSGLDKYYISPGPPIIPWGQPYCNSGVLLLNLTKCRQDNLMAKVFRYVKEHSDRIYFPDQDALNVLMQGKWLHLHPRWNVQSSMFKMCYKRKQRCTVPRDIIEAVKNPAIIHYTEAIKSWHYECLVPYVEEYYKYLAMTPWKDYTPKRPPMEGIMKKHRRKFKRRFKSMFLGYRI